MKSTAQLGSCLFDSWILEWYTHMIKGKWVMNSKQNVVHVQQIAHRHEASTESRIENPQHLFLLLLLYLRFIFLFSLLLLLLLLLWLCKGEWKKKHSNLYFFHLLGRRRRQAVYKSIIGIQFSLSLSRPASQPAS